MSHLDDWPVGAKVTVRTRLPQGKFTDTLGILRAQNETHMHIETRRHGLRVVMKADIAIGKLIELPTSTD